jgi:hypothetical protein
MAARGHQIHQEAVDDLEEERFIGPSFEDIDGLPSTPDSASI